jgi:phosphate transport system substrate-binding protein
MNNDDAVGRGLLRLYPNVKIEIEGKGSSTAPTALIAGTSSDR